MTKIKRMRKRILSIAIPSGLTFLLDVINLTVAILFIGSYGKENIAALGVGINYVVICYIWASAIFYVGTNAQVSRLFGSKNYTSMNECFSTLFFCCILSCIPLQFISVLGIDYYIKWMKLIPQTAILTKDFLSISIYLVPLFLLKNIIVSAFSAIGNTKIPFYVKIFLSILNLCVGFLLIIGIKGYYTGFGIKGAAYTNIIIASCEFLLLILCVLSKKHIICFKAKLHWLFFKRGVIIGFPSGVERICTFFALLLTAKYLVVFGDGVLAGAQIGERIESFCYMPGFGFMVTSMSLVGQCIGGANLKRAKLYVNQILLISGVLMGSIGLFMVLFAPHLARLFSSDASVVKSATIYLYILGISQLPLVWMFVFDGVIRGAGKTIYSLVVNCGSVWLLRLLPMYILLVCGFGYEVIYACVTIETFLRAGIFFIIYKSGIWSKNLAF